MADGSCSDHSKSMARKVFDLQPQRPFMMLGSPLLARAFCAAIRTAGSVECICLYIAGLVIVRIVCADFSAGVMRIIWLRPRSGNIPLYLQYDDR